MIHHYITITLRHLRKDKVYTLINVAGLAIGMASCLIIGLYAEDELSFDRFHDNADRIILIAQDHPVLGRGKLTPFPLATALQDDLPVVEQAVRTSGVLPGPVIAGEKMYDGRVLFVDTTFFDVFTFPVVRGDARAALADPNAVILTEDAAQTYFGDADPIGRRLHFERVRQRYDLYVAAIVQAPPPTSSIDFDLLVSTRAIPERFAGLSGWHMARYRTYALLDETARPDAVEVSIEALAARHYGEDTSISFPVIPLTEVYFSDLTSVEGFKGQARYVYLFSGVALFILLIAAINYVNLATAQSTQRAREVGVLKTMGASRGEVIQQYLTESLILSTLALALAAALTALLLPAFNSFFGKAMSLSLSEDAILLLSLSGLVLLVGVSAGWYPALFLSSFQPTQVLKGVTRQRVGGIRLRKGLVVVQFGITIALLAGTVIVFNQLHFAQNRNLGFEGGQVVVVPLPDRQLRRQAPVFKRMILRSPEIVQATAASSVPGNFYLTFNGPARVFSSATDRTQNVSLHVVDVDYDFLDMLAIDVVAGRAFAEAFPSDEEEGYILNKEAVKLMGWRSGEVISKPFKLGDRKGTVVRVAENFHFDSFRTPIAPLVFRVGRPAATPPSYSVIAAKLDAQHIRQGLSHIEQQWAVFAPNHPFAYSFLDDDFDALYRTEIKLGQVLVTFALLAIVLSCLGLFSLAALTIAHRTKEIGIRKVFGASIPSIVADLSVEYLRLIGVAFVIAAPVVYVAMNRWLADFAYHVDISVSTFMLVGGLSLLMVFASVGYQSVKAAWRNPVEALQYE